MKVLVTGGAGYVASHTVRLLLEKKIDVVILDNLERGHLESIPSGVKLEKCDIREYDKVKQVFANSAFDAVFHFAAYTYVGESVEHPDMYYLNNVIGSYNLIDNAVKSGVKKFIFSSTCSVYGNPLIVPITEEESTKPINPYANTKLVIEKILADYDVAYGLKSVCLRYFNAAGAAMNGIIGESHQPEPHLIPLIIEVALGKRKSIKVFGNDYPTPDGTCVRDYIHVDDLAQAHYLALNYIETEGKSNVFNLGTGIGSSVKEVIDAVANITKTPIPADIVERREGDPAILMADNKKAREVLKWNPKLSLTEVIESAYKWYLAPKY